MRIDLEAGSMMGCRVLNLELFVGDQYRLDMDLMDGMVLKSYEQRIRRLSVKGGAMNTRCAGSIYCCPESELWNV